MIEIKNPEPLLRSVVSAGAVTGIDVASSKGDQCMLAIIDQDGKVLDCGPAVAQNVWNANVRAMLDFWEGNGHIKTTVYPAAEQQKAA